MERLDAGNHPQPSILRSEVSAKAPSALVVGCGYLGARLVPLLLSAGYRVGATTTTPEKLPKLAALGAEPYLFEISRPDESEVWGFPWKIVVYAVAPRGAQAPEVAFRKGAVGCARRILEGSPGKLEKFVYISSTGVYGETAGGWVDEGSPATPPEPRLEPIRQAEDELRALWRSSALPAVILRLGGIYGPGRSPSSWLLQSERRARILQGGRDAFMNWVRVEDAAQAALLAAQKGQPGEIYLIVDDEPVTRGDFYRRAAELAGMPPLDLAPSEERGKRCSNEKARRELGFVPRFPTYREGLVGI